MGTTLISKQSTGARVLIVEDEAIIAADLKAILEELGYVIPGIASSGVSALQLAATQSADLVLMDIRIKGKIDGIQTANQLQERHQLPVVYLTAHTDDATLERARATAPFGYVTKPITPGGIKAAVAVALERHRLQQQQKEREVWLYSALTNMGEAVLLCDEERRITFMNSAAETVTMTSLSRACGKPLEQVVRVINGDGYLQPLKATTTGDSEQAAFLAGKLLRSDGSTRHVLLSIAGIGSGSEAGGTVAVIRDISDIRKMERDLFEANSSLTRSNQELTFLSHSLMHDLRDPLNTVSLLSQMLANEVPDTTNESAREYLLAIGETCLRMNSLVSSLRDYCSAVSLNRQVTELIDSSVAYQEAIQNLKGAITSSKAEIDCSGLPNLYVHHTALLLIFQNLIGNAIKYAGEEVPRIQISADRVGDFWQFTVVDQGLGFEPAQRERIFELFRRAHSRELSGSGIGLAICRRLVEQHGGRIWAECTPGQSTKFHFTLPAVEGLAAAAGQGA